MANTASLTPFKPGQSGNPAGRPKGVKNLSTIIKRTLADEKTLAALLAEAEDKSSVKLKKMLEKLPTKRGAEALAWTQLLRALTGDHYAVEWLRKAGYGDKIDLDGEDSPLATLLGGLGAALTEVVNANQKRPLEKPSNASKPAKPTNIPPKAVKPSPAIERPANTPHGTPEPKPLADPKILDVEQALKPKPAVKLKQLPRA